MRRLFEILGLFFLMILFFVVLRLRGDINFSFFARVLASGDYLLNLIDKQNSIVKYEPLDLVDLSELGASGKYIRKIVYMDLKNLVDSMEIDRVPIKILSAYRSFDTQKVLFSSYKKRFKEAHRFSAQAGHSEHQLGTTVDFGIGNRKIDLRAAFGTTPQGKWLEDNAWKFGFVLSYPEDSEEITGYIYEPWHLRYIGKEAAKEWKESGLTLREFVSQKPQYFLDYPQ